MNTRCGVDCVKIILAGGKFRDKCDANPDINKPLVVCIVENEISTMWHG
jgi:hypothetical protein